ncbi:MAG: S8 family serine peptidase, partial [Nitrososphaeraceae archaeon]
IRTYDSLEGYVMKIPEYLKSFLIEELRNDPRVAHIEPDQKVYALNHMQTLPTGVDRIDGDLSYTKAGDGSGSVPVVDVAILDTGIDLTHPDLNVYRAATFVSGTSSASDDNGHGTLVAGIVGAKDNHVGVVGVAPDARLWAVKVLDRSGTGLISDIIAGIDYITEHSNEIDAANLSFGCRCSSAALDSAINSAVAAGITFAVAAGNENIDANSYTPANNPNVLAVSAIADTDGRCGANGPSSSFGSDDTLASFSNYGSVIDMAAPGVGILSTSMNGGYAKMSGTSASAPHVTGAAALYIAQHPNVTPSEVKSALVKYSVGPSAICDGKGSGYFTGDRDSIKEPLLLVRFNDNQDGSADSIGEILYHKWQAFPSSSRNWNAAWRDLGSAITVRGDPIVAQNSDGRLEIFAVSAANNQLYHKYQTSPSSSNSWSAWINTGSAITIRGDPIVAKNSDGRLEIFAVSAANNQLYHKWQTKAGDSKSWSSAWQSLGGNIKSTTEPVIVSNSDGRLEIFAVSSVDSKLYHKWQTVPSNSKSWSGWGAIGDAISIAGDPVVAKNADGRLEVFAVNPGSSPTNQPPTADSKSMTTSMNTAVDITLSGKDPENGPLTFTVADLPKSGNVAPVAGSANTVRYTPNTGFTGSDSFTYTAKDNKGAVSAKATVSISVTGGGGGGDAGQNDKFGIKKIYASKPQGEQWFMNMADPSNDPRTSEPSMSKNSDGSWRVTSGQVRYGVFTSSGYLPDQVEKDHSVIASRGYMQSPNDWKNVEMTGQVKYNSGGDDEWTWYARGGRHTGSGWEEGCEGVALKGSLAYTGGQVRWAKEQWHVSYVFQPWKNSPADGDGKFVGFKVAIYNMQLNGKTVVKMESWVDPNNNNQWQKVYDFIHQGGWGSEGGECRGASDQIVTWGGPIASFRWDDGNSIDIKNLSVREIVPPSQ